MNEQEAWDRAMNVSSDPVYQWLLEESRKPYWMGTVPKQHDLDRPVELDPHDLEIKRLF